MTVFFCVSLPRLCSAISTPVPTSSGRCFSITSLNILVISLGSSVHTSEVRLESSHICVPCCC